VSAAENRPISASEAAVLLDYLTEIPVVLIAASGGPDSTALLWLMARWRKRKKSGPKLIAVTIDHALRPESKTEAHAVARLARKLGVAHRTLRWTGKKPKTGIQEAAREARYRLLADAARKSGARCVLTAHTLDDQAETLLFRMARGSGVSGLTGMDITAPMPFDDSGTVLVRPLLRVPKARLVATLDAAKVGYADDPTNRDPRFARPRWRTLMPALAEEGLTPERLGRLARRVSRLEWAMQEVVKTAANALAPGPWTNGQVTIEAQAFFRLPDEIKLRLLGAAIDRIGDEGPVELGKLEALLDALIVGSEGGRFRRTLAGAVISLSGEMVGVERAPPRRSRASKRP
jgi:tRNA(Ile)-lysidine synthase